MELKTTQEKVDEIKLLMQYAVPEEHRTVGIELLEKHGADRVALNLFHSFYSYLPDARDDVIQILRELERHKGAFLISATTLFEDYLYIVTQEKAEFVGTLSKGIWDEEVLKFFGFTNRESFLKKFRDISNVTLYTPVAIDRSLCPACSVADGEYHVFGCPVEICPWCESQFTSCNCRFTQLNKNKLERESHLQNLLEKAEKKGRIPFDAAKHMPAFPSDGSTTID